MKPAMPGRISRLPVGRSELPAAEMNPGTDGSVIHPSETPMRLWSWSSIRTTSDRIAASSPVR